MKTNRLNLEQQRAITAQFQRAVDTDPAVAAAAMEEIAEALITPLRKVMLSGDIQMDIFESMDFTTNPNIEFPLDLLTPGDEAEYYAYTIPAEGRLPERRVEGDYLRVPTFMIGNSIDCNRRYIRDASWPVVSRMIEVLEAGFLKKMNDDGWQTILAAAKDRNIIIFDNNASAGQFTPRLVTLLSSFMRRNGGGNSATGERSRLTDMYLSPEAHMDIRSWGIDLVSDSVRRDIYYANDNSGDLINIFGVNLHAYDEFGEGQEYQTYYTSDLSGTMASGDVEIVVGLDRQRNDSFVRPVREDIQIFEDNTMHRRNLFGLYARAEMGFAVLDSRRTLLGSL